MNPFELKKSKIILSVITLLLLPEAAFADYIELINGQSYENVKLEKEGERIRVSTSEAKVFYVPLDQVKVVRMRHVKWQKFQGHNRLSALGQRILSSVLVGRGQIKNERYWAGGLLLSGIGLAGAGFLNQRLTMSRLENSQRNPTFGWAVFGGLSLLSSQNPGVPVAELALFGTYLRETRKSYFEQRGQSHARRGNAYLGGLFLVYALNFLDINVLQTRRSKRAPALNVQVLPLLGREYTGVGLTVSF